METQSTDPQDIRHPLNLIQETLRAIGEDPDREGLIDTPGRVIRSWGTLFGGYKMDPKKILERTFEGGTDQMVMLRDIEFYSACEHHMIPFFGRVHIAYLPKDRVVGISKLARLVECFSRRLQIQERLTDQISDAIMDNLDPIGCGVVIEAQHLCMVARGVQKQNSVMVTSSLQGAFRTDNRTREEFLSCVLKR